MELNAQEKLVELFKSPIKNIREEANLTIVEFENGEEIPLYGGGQEIQVNIPVCSFCGQPALNSNEFLFTTNESVFICINCNVLAMETFLKHGADIKLNIGEYFPEAAEEIKKLTENIKK